MFTFVIYWSRLGMSKKFNVLLSEWDLSMGYTGLYWWIRVWVAGARPSLLQVVYPLLPPFLATRCTWQTVPTTKLQNVKYKLTNIWNSYHEYKYTKYRSYTPLSNSPNSIQCTLYHLQNTNAHRKLENVYPILRIALFIGWFIAIAAQAEQCVTGNRFQCPFQNRLKSSPCI